MKKTPLFVVLVLVLVVYGAFLLISYNQEVTVVNLVRTITDTSDLDDRDCLITAQDSTNKYVKAYAEAEACTYLEVGDRVRFEDGYLK